MNSDKLLDSRRFCLLMDDLARTWRDKKAKDEDKAYRLQAVLDFLGEQNTICSIPEIKPASTVKGVGIRTPPPPVSQNLDPLAPALEFAREIAATVSKTPPRPDGLRMVIFPTSVDPNMVASACEADRTIPFMVDAADEPISMPIGGGDWIVPCRTR